MLTLIFENMRRKFLLKSSLLSLSSFFPWVIVTFDWGSLVCQTARSTTITTTSPRRCPPPPPPPPSPSLLPPPSSPSPFFFLSASSVPYTYIQRLNKTYLLISIISPSISSMKGLSSWADSDSFCPLWELRIILGFASKWVGRKHDSVMWECLRLERHCG